MPRCPTFAQPKKCKPKSVGSCLVHPCHIICRCPLNKLHFPMSGKFCDCRCTFLQYIDKAHRGKKCKLRMCRLWIDASPHGIQPPPLGNLHFQTSVPSCAYHILLHITNADHIYSIQQIYQKYKQGPKLRFTKAIVSKSYRSRSLAKSTYMVLEHVKQWLLIWRCISIHLHRINNTGT